MVNIAVGSSMDSSPRPDDRSRAERTLMEGGKSALTVGLPLPTLTALALLKTASNLHTPCLRTVYHGRY